MQYWEHNDAIMYARLKESQMDSYFVRHSILDVSWEKEWLDINLIYDSTNEHYAHKHFAHNLM